MDQIENLVNEEQTEIDKKIHRLDPSIIVELDNVSKTFDRKTWAVRRVNLQVKKGDCLALLGANGSGKSTLARLIGNVIKQTTGTVDYYFNNENIFTSIGYQSREQSWPNGFRVKDIVTLWISIYNVQDQEWISRLKNTFEIEKNENKYLSKLSTVYLQLFAIFLAMLHKPEVLIIDELSSSIDFESKTKIITLFQDYLKEENTIIMVAPDSYILESLAKRIVYLHHGKIIDDLTTQEITTNYKNIFNYIKEVSLSADSSDKKRRVDPALRPLLKNYKELQTQLEHDYHQFVENQLAKKYAQVDTNIKNTIFLVTDLGNKFQEMALSDINKESVDQIRVEAKKTIKGINKLLKQIKKLKKKNARLKKLTQLEKDFAQIVHLLEDNLKDSLDNNKLVVNGDEIDIEMPKNTKKELEILKERYIKEELKIIRLERRKVEQTDPSLKESLQTKLMLKDLSKKEKNVLKTELTALEAKTSPTKVVVLDNKNKVVIKTLEKVNRHDRFLFNQKSAPTREKPTFVQVNDPNTEIYYDATIKDLAKQRAKTAKKPKKVNRGKK